MAASSVDMTFPEVQDMLLEQLGKVNDEIIGILAKRGGGEVDKQRLAELHARVQEIENQIIMLKSVWWRRGE